MDFQRWNFERDEKKINSEICLHFVEFKWLTEWGNTKQMIQMNSFLRISRSEFTTEKIRIRKYESLFLLVAQ